MKVAICKGGLQFVVISESKFNRWFVVCCKNFTLAAFLSLDIYPAYIMMLTIGCGTEPISTVTLLPSTLIIGTCFSTAASVVLAVSSSIFSPQHFMGTPVFSTKPTRFRSVYKIKLLPFSFHSKIILSVILPFLIIKSLLQLSDFIAL